MTLEVCPFCGKTFKRLKSHLPYCRAAGKETSSHPTAKVKKTASLSAHLQTETSKKVSVISSKPATAPHSVNAASSSLPPTAKKKKQKLVDQIKMANTLSSDTVSLICSPPPVMSEPKNKKEAPKSKPVSKGSLEGTDVVFHSNTSTTAWSKLNSDKDSVRDVTKPRDTVKKKRSKAKNAAESSSVTKTALDFLDIHRNEPHPGDFMGDNEGGDGNLSAGETCLKSTSGHKAKITLQHVKATLRRARANDRCSGTSILSHVETVGEPIGLSPVTAAADRQRDGCVRTAKPPSDVLAGGGSHRAESDKDKSLNSDQGSSLSVPVVQPKTNSPPAPLLPGCPASPGSLTALCTHTASAKVGLKVGHHMTGLLSPSPIQFPRPHAFRLPPPVRAAALRAEEGSSAEKSRLDVVKQNAAHGRTGGDLTQLQLGQVKLRELPEWLSCKTPRNLKDLGEMVQRGYRWYHKRYIDVKKGGVGGLGMLLAGYCVLSYIWSYPRLKQDRWRKYH